MSPEGGTEGGPSSLYCGLLRMLGTAATLERGGSTTAVLSSRIAYMKMTTGTCGCMPHKTEYAGNPCRHLLRPHVGKSFCEVDVLVELRLLAVRAAALPGRPLLRVRPRAVRARDDHGFCIILVSFQGRSGDTGRDPPRRKFIQI